MRFFGGRGVGGREVEEEEGRGEGKGICVCGLGSCTENWTFGAMFSISSNQEFAYFPADLGWRLASSSIREIFFLSHFSFFSITSREILGIIVSIGH